MKCRLLTTLDFALYLGIRIFTFYTELFLNDCVLFAYPDTHTKTCSLKSTGWHVRLPDVPLFFLVAHVTCPFTLWVQVILKCLEKVYHDLFADATFFISNAVSVI